MMKIKALFAAMLLVSVFSCTKPAETPGPLTETDETYKGKLGVSVKIYTAVGNCPPGAQVNIASSADSLANGLYIDTKFTNGLGNAEFEDIDFGTGTTRKIYYNAFLQLNSENFTGDGEVILPKDEIIHNMLIIYPIRDE